MDNHIVHDSDKAEWLCVLGPSSVKVFGFCFNLRWSGTALGGPGAQSEGPLGLNSCWKSRW